MKQVREKRDIEWLVRWALQEDASGAGDLIGPGWSTSSSDRLAALAALGTTVQTSRFVPSMRDSHPDITVITRAIGEMGGDPRIADVMALVHQHGRRGDRPDWGRDGCGRYVLVRGDDGNAKRRYADRRQARGLLGFHFEFEGYSPEEIEFMMIQYVGWHEALAALRDRINRQMTGHEATGPSAPDAPWDMQDGVIHIDGREPVAAER